MVVVSAESDSDSFTVSITAKIPASTPLYQQDQLGTHLANRANLLIEHLEEFLIEHLGED